MVYGPFSEIVQIPKINPQLHRMHVGSFFGLLFGGIGSEMRDAAGFRDSLWYVPLHDPTRILRCPGSIAVQRHVYLHVRTIKRCVVTWGQPLSS